MQWIKLVLRPRVLSEVVKLLALVGDAYKDGVLSRKERAAVWKQFWAVVRAYRGY
tara:strand:- start:3633 stop:3797 length:165 start_codon:yes stop_codon:yes gene_type:complete